MIDIHFLQPTQLLYEAIQRPSIKGEIQIINFKSCPLCGMLTNVIIPWKVPSKFTDLDIFAEKEKLEFLCPACSFTLSNIKALHKPYILTLKTGFHLLHFDDDTRERETPFGHVLKISRMYLIDFLLNYPKDDPWIMMLQSKINPQHSLIHAKVNYGESDTLYISEGQTVHMIPTKELKQLLHSLMKIKCSDSLYPYLFVNKVPKKNHPEIEIWDEVAEIIIKHRHKHYLSFLYDRIIPPKNYLLVNNEQEK